MTEQTNEAVTITRTFADGTRNGCTLTVKSYPAAEFKANPKLQEIKYTHFNEANEAVNAVEFSRNQFKV